MDLNAKEKARELADMVGSLVVDENLPLEVMEMTADLLKEDCEEIRQAVVDIAEEERAIHEQRTGTTLRVNVEYHKDKLEKGKRPGIEVLGGKLARNRNVSRSKILKEVLH